MIHTYQEELEELLKKKGIGPEGSKSLRGEELSRLTFLLHSENTSLTTQATILTAMLTLPPTGEEQQWLQTITAGAGKNLPPGLRSFIQPSDNPFLTLIQKVIRHTDLTEEESRQAMDFFFDPGVPVHYKASFLEAERLKRESFTENKIFFQAMYERCRRIQLQIPLLIDICDNYDGSNRSRSYSLFTASLLASAGYPVVLHGTDKVAPKFGITHLDILRAAGKDPLISHEQAARNLQSPEIGWAYIDQSLFFPELDALKTMRKEMVKRPFLATFEKLLQPLRAAQGNFLVTGFTHSHYKQEVAAQIREMGKSARALVVKGVEGASHMSLAKNTMAVLYNGREIEERSLHPSQFGLPEMEQKQDRTVTASDSFREGQAALEGARNYAYYNIIYLAAAILESFELTPAGKSLPLLTGLMDSGKALRHWEKGNREKG